MWEQLSRQRGQYAPRLGKAIRPEALASSQDYGKASMAATRGGRVRVCGGRVGTLKILVSS